MIKGGYKIIDLGDVDFGTGKSVTIPGIYDHFKNSYRKATMISGLTFGGKKVESCFVQYSVSGSNYVFGILGKQFTVTSEDKVTMS